MFKETKPLPSYLVAVAVGPFEIVDAGTTGRKSTAVRIVVPRGRGQDARFAVESTPRILALLEDYFDEQKTTSITNTAPQGSNGKPLPQQQSTSDETYNGAGVILVHTAPSAAGRSKVAGAVEIRLSICH